MHRVLAILLALYLLCPCAVLAEEVEDPIYTGDNYTYRILEDETLTLIEYLGDSVSVTVPEHIGDYPVSRLEGTFYYKPVVSVWVPEGVTYISHSTFMQCTELESVILPSTLKFLGQAAFLNCQKLKDINLPAGLETLEDYVFLNCLSLKELRLYPSVSKMDENALVVIPDPDKVLLPETCNLLVSTGSYAEEYAKAHALPYKLLPQESASR